MALDGAEIEGGRGQETPSNKGSKTRLLTLEDLDARTRARKRAEETRQSLIDDLGAGGLSRADLIRIKQCALMDAVIEDMQVRAVKGDGIDRGDRATLATLVNTFSRHLESLSARSTGKAQRKPDSLDARDIARAILDILQDAELEADSEPTAALPGPSTASFTTEQAPTDTGASDFAK